MWIFRLLQCKAGRLFAPFLSLLGKTAASHCAAPVTTLSPVIYIIMFFQSFFFAAMPEKRASDNGERVVLEELGDGGWRNKLFHCPAGPLQETVRWRQEPHDPNALFRCKKKAVICHMPHSLIRKTLNWETNLENPTGICISVHVRKIERLTCFNCNRQKMNGCCCWFSELVVSPPAG